MQGRRRPSYGDDGERHPRGSGGASVGFQPAGTSGEFPQVQPVEAVSVGALRRHGVSPDGDTSPTRLPLDGGVGPRRLLQRQGFGVVPRLQHQLGQDVVFGIAAVLPIRVKNGWFHIYTACLLNVNNTKCMFHLSTGCTTGESGLMKTSTSFRTNNHIRI